MKILPEFRFGLLDGWLPLALYFLVFLVSLLPYSRETREWLFQNPVNKSKPLFLALRSIGQVTVFAFILLMIATPLADEPAVWLPGAALFLAGVALVVSALDAFRRTPLGQPVANGPYRISRNPQWVGLFLVLLGSAVMAGVWIYLAMLLAVAAVYHIQILDEEALCLEKIGEKYRDYLKRVPRYLLFF